MPSSSYSSGFSCRGVISSNLNASDAMAEEHILGLQATKESPMAFEVPPLPYGYDALEPHIDEQTMRVHHDKHHQAYVDNANKALEGTDWADRPPESILANLELIPDDRQAAIRNNVGGHVNHTLFWEIMSPDGGGEPSGSLGAAIQSTFGGLDELKEAVNDAGVKRFGSGWTWLGHGGTGLAGYPTPKQGPPVSQAHMPLPDFGPSVSARMFTHCRASVKRWRVTVLPANEVAAVT